MKRIHLDMGNVDIIISDEAYAQIEQLVEANRVCATCETGYTDDNPMVLLNKCLDCFLASQNGTNLSYIGRGELTRYGQEHTLIDEDGYIYVTSTGYTRPERSEYQTILHHGFGIPASYEAKGETITLDSYHWRVYGDVKKSAVVINHENRYGNTKDVAFLSYKDGTYKLLTNQKGEIKYLLERATNIAEGMKDANGYYHINGYETYRLTNWYLYYIVADIASMEYNISLLHKELTFELEEQEVV